jgi:hypothetical protein
MAVHRLITNRCSAERDDGKRRENDQHFENHSAPKPKFSPDSPIVHDS